MFGSIVEALRKNAQCSPNKLCFVDASGEYTYREVEWEIDKLICLLYEKYFIKKRNTIVVECNQQGVYLEIAMACQWLGVIFVPVEHNVAEERIRNVVKEVNASLIISDKIYESDVKSISYAELLEQCKNLKEYKKNEGYPEEEDVAEILFTTGTTGKPKGIVLTNINNVAIAENIICGTKMNENSVELVPLPLSHSHGLRTCYANIVNGSTIVLVDGVTRVKNIFDLINKYKITALDLSPSAARVLIKLSKGALKQYQDQIDFVQIGTAMLDEELKEQLCLLLEKSRLYNFYGSTEAGRVCVLDFKQYRGKGGCIGFPAKHASFVITDNERNIIESSSENMGLIAISGKMNMKMYFQEPELTQSIMKNGYIFTNDLGYIDQSGMVYVMGRADDVINYRGIKISPEEIEGPMRKYPGVLDCACIPEEDAMCGQVPKLFVVMESDREKNTSDLLTYLSLWLEENKLPKRIQYIDEIPRTSNGKILRKELAKL